MKTGKKITVGLAVTLVVAIFAAGAVSMVGAQFTEELPPFTVTVSAFDVSIDLNETDFGEVLPGTTKEIHSFDVINAGIIDALVEARFTTDENDIYGLTGGSVIAAENFKLNEVALDNDGDDVAICTAPAADTTSHNAKLSVPVLQPDAVYSGTVELIFSPIL
jgi:hypothetical protein